MNNIRKTALALIAAAAVSANTSQADEGAQAVVPPRPFANLVSDDAALQAWWNGTNSLNKSQPVFAFNGMPLDEVAQRIVNIFKNQFDLILPADSDLSTIPVKLELKNVNAIEIFNALNIYFETGNIPAHWKLTLNGSRPTALLEMKKPKETAPAEPERKHTVFSIADILYSNGPKVPPERVDETMEAVNAVLQDIQKPNTPAVNTPGGPQLKIHMQAGILVFTGTSEETELVRSTLQALTQTAAQQKIAEMTHTALEGLKK